MQQKFNHLNINGKVYSDNDIDILANALVSESENEQYLLFGELLQTLRNDNSYIEVLTSGSTGTPKIIQLKKQHLINSAQTTISYFQINQNSTIVCCLPLNHIAGIMMIVRAFVSKSKLILVAPSSNPIAALEHEVDFIAMTPYQLSHSLQSIEDKKCIKTILLGGSAIGNSLMEQIKNLPCNVFHSYGMTETCSHIALRNCKTEDRFTVLNAISISLNENNCLKIDAPTLCNEILETNDIAKIVNNTFLIIGRFDNIINSGGIKLSPEAIENKLSTHLDIPFFISSIPDLQLQEKLVLVLNSVENIELEISITELCDSILDKYERPKHIFFCNNFIFTASNKIDRKKTIHQIIGK